MITQSERRKLWGVYPDVRELFEEYNDTILEDDGAWARLVNQCHGILDQYHGSEVVKSLLVDVTRQLEKLSRKRKYG